MLGIHLSKSPKVQLHHRPLEPVDIPLQKYIRRILSNDSYQQENTKETLKTSPVTTYMKIIQNFEILGNEI